MKVATSEDFAMMTEYAIQILKRARTLELKEVTEYVKNISGEKQKIYEYLELFKIWFRDVLMFKATREVDNLIFKNEINHIREQAKIGSYEGLEEILEAIDKAKVRLNANVNFDLTMELLFLTVRENLK